MSQTHVISDAAGAVPDARTPRRQFRQALFAWMRDYSGTRSRRVFLLVLALWIFNLFDLNFTLLALRIGWFTEANPIARLFIGSGDALIIFKFAMIIPASMVLLAIRRSVLTEIGCWILCAAHLLLAVSWLVYYTEF